MKKHIHPTRFILHSNFQLRTSNFELQVLRSDRAALFGLQVLHDAALGTRYSALI